MTEQIMCRHGVALCYQCGVGPNATAQKTATMVKMQQAFKQRSVNSPTPTLTRSTKKKADKNTKTKKPRSTPCIHRGEYVGTLDCACDGARDTYRCTKIDRPEHPGEKAICIEVLTSKSYSRIVDSKTKTTLHRVQNGEVALCRELHTIEINGKKQVVGCSKYRPIEGNID